MNANSAACRFCDAPLEFLFLDLGMSPLCESYVAAENLAAMEPFYPLDVRVCSQCLLVQLREYVGASDIFSEYAYFSSFSQSWLKHAQTYVEMVVDRFGINKRSQVVEVASNDGYLLQFFIERGIPSLGIEPAANVAQFAIEKGVPSRIEFFSRETAQRLVSEGIRADLLLGNNVLAHVPDLNSFVEGLRILLAEQGILTLEFPHLQRLIEENQFDTIYHEHFCYFSFLAVERILKAHALTIFDVEELKSHGGSLRLFVCHENDTSKVISARVLQLRQRELNAGYAKLETYSGFAAHVAKTKWELLEFLINARRQGKSIVGYGAPGKGNTLLNYCGIRTDLLEYTVDRNPYKQGKYLPGTHIPVFAPEKIAQTRPDFVLLLPWNLKNELVSQLSYIRQWGGKCVVPIPTVQIVSDDEC